MDITCYLTRTIDFLAIEMSIKILGIETFFKICIPLFCFIICNMNQQEQLKSYVISVTVFEHKFEKNAEQQKHCWNIYKWSEFCPIKYGVTQYGRINSTSKTLISYKFSTRSTKKKIDQHRKRSPFTYSRHEKKKAQHRGLVLRKRDVCVLPSYEVSSRFLFGQKKLVRVLLLLRSYTNSP